MVGCDDVHPRVLDMVICWPSMQQFFVVGRKNKIRECRGKFVREASVASLGGGDC